MLAERDQSGNNNDTCDHILKGMAVYTVDVLIRRIMSEDKQYDLPKIVTAYHCAESAHEGQTRTSGEAYITHPIAVAYILIELGMDTDTICAALLHDVVEDTEITLEELKGRFGQDVALLVDGVTKLGKIPLFTKEEQQAENVRKILLAMSQDIRVIIIKLCDRLHNMRTLKCRPPEKRLSTALETMSIYAPIAHRLGIRAVKEELEDLAFRYLDPYAYDDIEQLMAKTKDQREALIEAIRLRIARRLEDTGLVKNVQVEGRVKSVYGIYKKVYMSHKSFEEIYDKYAVRVIVPALNECYNVLGIIHDMFKPIPNRFKDYISTPKPNMYQSIHTTVIGREGIPFEVQIRTWDMHYTAEYGIAAHWKYKEGIHRKNGNKFDGRLAWIRQIIEAQQDADDIEEIVRTIKNDLAPEEVFAFTPKGDMISLPIGSTVIDFAYAIHTQVGNKMCGAKVDGKLVSLDYNIRTGEIVEIVTTKDPTHGPNRSWLDIVKTNEAKSKIRSWFKKECREENIVKGRQDLEREFKKYLIQLPENELTKFLSDDMKRHNCDSMEDFYAAIGYGGIILSRMMQRLKESYIKIAQANASSLMEPDIVITPQTVGKKSVDGVIVEGINNCLIKFSQCCNPLPGDAIVGFITRGHGVSIHKNDCINYVNAVRDKTEPERWVNVYWSDIQPKERSFKVILDIVSHDRHGLLADVGAILSDMRVPIHEMSAKELKNGNANMLITISTAGMEHLSNIVQRVRKIPGVISVDRTGK